MTYKLLILFFALFLSSCNPLMPWRPTSYDIQKEGQAPKDYVKRESLYCYKTIGETMCYTEPRPDPAQSLAGYYGPPPPAYDRPATEKENESTVNEFFKPFIPHNDF